ncbi:MAG: pyridoxamine 5'-phosphate oxidase family protein [Acidimicrobiia bacterium]|nr:pyridoxamine 5'-phosphate oxidase family protein [Acidimicrobiia bacterium]
MEPDIQRPDMAAYGVPEELDGALSWGWAEEQLHASRNYWVVTVDTDGKPHATPVWGVWYEDRFWFGAAPTSLKVRNIVSNPQVAVMGEDTVNVVSIEGTARLVEGRTDVARTWAERYEPDPDKRQELAAFMVQGAFVEVTPVKAIGLIESEERFSSSATRWVW